MSIKTAHNLDDKVRTADIFVDKDVTFEGMNLLDETLDGLQKCGFLKPSPIQHRAVPLGRCGFDLILQAKSGTGKTVVFGVIALEMVQPTSSKLQVLILAPTREIAVQIQEVLSSIGCCFKGLKVESFIGGTPLDEDRKKLQGCHIAVGAPGRISHLVQKKVLNTDHIRLFILDEVDKLLESSFLTDINIIYTALPQRKQVIVSSATYSHHLDEFVTQYMDHPSKISPRQEPPILLGIRQYVTVVKYDSSPEQQLILQYNEINRILTSVPFHQCLIFVNLKKQAENLSSILRKNNWPVEIITSSQDQKDRLQSITKLKEFKCRILVSTDITARGIDAENVNLVINLDVPFAGSTYLHRIGRAGRYGSQGISVTLAAGGSEMSKFLLILGEIGGTDMCVNMLPEGKIPDLWDFKEPWAHSVVYGEIGSSSTRNNAREIRAYADETLIAFNTPDASPLKSSSKINIMSDKSNKIDTIEKQSHIEEHFNNSLNTENIDSICIEKFEITSQSSENIKNTTEILKKNKSLLSVAALMVNTSKENIPIESFTDIFTDFENSQRNENLDSTCDSVAIPLENIDDLMNALENYEEGKEENRVNNKTSTTKIESHITPNIEKDIKYLLDIKKANSSSNNKTLSLNLNPKFKSNKLFLEKVREATSDLDESYFDDSNEISAENIGKQLSPKKINVNDKKAVAKLQMEEDKKLLTKIKTKINFGDKTPSNIKYEKKVVNEKQMEEDRKFLESIKAKAKKEDSSKYQTRTPINSPSISHCTPVKKVDVTAEEKCDNKIPSTNVIKKKDVTNNSTRLDSSTKEIKKEDTYKKLENNMEKIVVKEHVEDSPNLNIKLEFTENIRTADTPELKNLPNNNTENNILSKTNDNKSIYEQFNGKSIDLTSINVDSLTNRSKEEIVQYLSEVLTKQVEVKASNEAPPKVRVLRRNTYNVIKVDDLTSDNIDGENLETSNIVGEKSNTSDLTDMDSSQSGKPKSGTLKERQSGLDKSGCSKETTQLHNTSLKFSDKVNSAFENRKTDNIKRKNKKLRNAKQSEVQHDVEDMNASNYYVNYQNEAYNRWCHQWISQVQQIQNFVQQNSYYRSSLNNHMKK